MNMWGITDRGVVREENQDAYALLDLSDRQQLAVVCDGMGGARAGNIASTMAVEEFSNVFSELWNTGERKGQELMQTAAARANEAVHHRSVADSGCYGMGTTMVAVYLDGKKAMVLNEGDSRAYLITPETIFQVTQDHSLVEDLVRRGELTPEQARIHPNKNLITRALGAETNLHADLFELDVEPGQYFLLCSDGLSNVVSEQEILYEVLHGGPVEQCCTRLLEIAIKRGAPDNVTVVLVEC
ncbi:MAG: Stp1/IreP family PP2C-type Ser/Thr phosphatase [Oscillospiraceae bacterium]|nr:Stp1/IreP family PP2C-type Ser/Thr phosphatase [Oscillospiraceae bacterium]